VGPQGTVKANIRAQLIIVNERSTATCKRKSVFVKETAKFAATSLPDGQHHGGPISAGSIRYGRQKAGSCRQAGSATSRPSKCRRAPVQCSGLRTSRWRSPMMNTNSSGVRPEPEPSATRPNGRTAHRIRIEPRPPQPAAAEPRAAEPRAPEARLPDAARVRPYSAPLCVRGEIVGAGRSHHSGQRGGSITHTQSLTVGTDGSMKGRYPARVHHLSTQVTT